MDSRHGKWLLFLSFSTAEEMERSSRLKHDWWQRWLHSNLMQTGEMMGLLDGVDGPQA